MPWLSRGQLSMLPGSTPRSVSKAASIIQHQALAMMLADMYIDILCGRDMVWRLAHMAKEGKSDRMMRIATKVFCTEAAVRVCKAATEVHGGLGIMREMPVQKYVRDALVLLHMDGTNQVSRIRLGGLIERRGAVQVPQLV